MKRLSSLILVFAFGLPSLLGQLVYPGDVTNNGEVNGIDALFIGLAYEQPNGFARASGTTAWNPVTIDMLWPSSFFNGLNHAYADCNGDGVINDFDLNVVTLNFDSTRNFANPDIFPTGTQGVNTELDLNIISSSPNILEGDTINLEISLGDVNLPATDFYGITFKIKYDADLFKDEAINFELSPNTWIDTDPNLLNVRMITKEDLDNGEAFIAITRTDKLPINGSGILGTFQIVVDDIVIGLSQDTSTSITIEDVVMMSPDMSISSIYAEDLPITITSDTALVISSVDSYEHEQPPILKLFPNPAKDLIIVESSEAIIEYVTLYDLLGQQHFVRQEVKGLNSVQLFPQGRLPKGLYLVSVKTDKGILSEKIIVE